VIAARPKRARETSIRSGRRAIIATRAKTPCGVTEFGTYAMLLPTVAAKASFRAVSAACREIRLIPVKP